jgi:hypothetical protein
MVQIRVARLPQCWKMIQFWPRLEEETEDSVNKYSKTECSSCAQRKCFQNHGVHNEEYTSMRCARDISGANRN